MLPSSLRGAQQPPAAAGPSRPPKLPQPLRSAVIRTRPATPARSPIAAPTPLASPIPRPPPRPEDLPVSRKTLWQSWLSLSGRTKMGVGIALGVWGVIGLFGFDMLVPEDDKRKARWKEGLPERVRGVDSGVQPGAAAQATAAGRPS